MMYLLFKLSLALGAVATGILALYLYWRLRWGPPAAGSVPVLAYHKVTPGFELGGTRVTPRQFRRQMEWLKAGGYRTATLSQVAGMMTHGRRAEGKLVCLTFDDAYQCIYRYAVPVLGDYGFTATIFVLTDYIGKDNDWDINWGRQLIRHLDWKEIRELQEAGFEIGSHGASHRDIRFLDDKELRRELADSKHKLEDGLGKEVTAFCYPFGRYNDRVRQAVMEAGYKCACSHSPGLPNAKIDIFAIRRCGVYLTDIMWGFRHKVDYGSSWFWVQDLWSRTVNFCAGGASLALRIFRTRS